MTETPIPSKTEVNILRVQALAEEALASAEEKRAAARLHDSEALSRQAQELHTRILIENSKIDNQVSALQLTQLQREEEFTRASDIYHRVYTLQDRVDGNTGRQVGIDSYSVNRCIATLTAWSRQSPNCEMTIYINSSGGEIQSGFALIDFLTELRHQGHKITTVALGTAASMAAVVLQAGDVRAMGKNAVLLLHEGSLSIGGSYSDIKDSTKLMDIYHEHILELFESRAKPINSRTTKAFLRKAWERRDYWLDAAEALKLGLVDEAR